MFSFSGTGVRPAALVMITVWLTPGRVYSACKAAAEQSWSLSTLTLPHPLVRVLVAESLYRAWSITTNHPYHRE